MAVNRFDRAASAQFVNTYDPIPFQELAQAAQMRQTKHDQNLARMDAAQAAADNLQAIPNSKDEVFVNNLRTKLDDLSTKYAGSDLSDPEVYRELRNNIRTAVDPASVNAVRQSHAGYQNYMKELARLEAAGKGTHPALRENFAGYDSINGESGIFDKLPTMGHNWNAQMEEFFDQVKETDMGFEDIADLPGYKRAVRGRSRARLEDYAENNAENFMSTPAGREMTKIARAEGVDPKQYVMDRLLEVAPTFESSAGGTPFAYGDQDKDGDGDDINFDRSTLANTRGGDVENVNRRKVESNLRSMESELEQLERIAPDSPEYTALKTKVNDIQDILAKAKTEGDKFEAEYNREKINELKTRLSASRLTNGLSDDTINNIESLILNTLDEYEDQDITKPTSLGIGFDVPGELELINKIQDETGLSRGKANRLVDKFYTDYKRDLSEGVNKAREVVDQNIKDYMSTTTSSKYTISPQYKKTSGITTYQSETTGEPVPSNIDAIISDINSGNFDNYMSENMDSNSKRKNRKLVDKIQANDANIFDYTVDWKTTQDGNLVMHAPVHATGKNKDEAGEHLGTMKVEISDPTLKTAFQKELYDRGDELNAWFASPIAFVRNREVKKAVSNMKSGEVTNIPLGTPENPLVNVTVEKNGLDYIVRVIDNNGNEVRKERATGTDNLAQKISSIEFLATKAAGYNWIDNNVWY